VGPRETKASNDKEKSTSKKLLIKKVKHDLSKVKCFNYDNNKHSMKDYLKPLQVSQNIAQGKLIFQGGFVDK